jgi:hypothetical protein
MKKECFKDITNEPRILDVDGVKRKDENTFKWETSHPTKYCNTPE